MSTLLDNYLTAVNAYSLENPRIEYSNGRAYAPGMSESDIRTRIVDAMTAQGLTKAELSRRAGVPYHALDKFLKGASVKTSAENATALCNALGISLDGEAEYQRLRQLFFQLDEEQRRFLIASVQGLLGSPTR